MNGARPHPALRYAGASVLPLSNRARVKCAHRHLSSSGGGGIITLLGHAALTFPIVFELSEPALIRDLVNPFPPIPTLLPFLLHLHPSFLLFLPPDTFSTAFDPPGYRLVS